jgi:hypothetical protein
LHALVDRHAGLFVPYELLGASSSKPALWFEPTNLNARGDIVCGRLDVRSRQCE